MEKETQANVIAAFNSSLNVFEIFYHDLNVAHVLNKCSKCHLFVINNSPVVQVHW